MKYAFNELREATNQAIDAARKEKERFDGESINWGDLSCVSIEYVLADEGDTFHRVWISEAGHACSKFWGFIRDHLELHGFKDIHVHTEW